MEGKKDGKSIPLKLNRKDALYCHVWYDMGVKFEFASATNHFVMEDVLETELFEGPNKAHELQVLLIIFRSQFCKLFKVTQYQVELAGPHYILDHGWKSGFFK